MPFRKWVVIGFAISCGAALFAGMALTLYSIGSAVLEASREAERRVKESRIEAAENKREAEREAEEKQREAAVRPDTAKRELANLAEDLEKYRRIVSRYPTEQGGLNALCHCPDTTTTEHDLQTMAMCRQHPSEMIIFWSPPALCSRRFGDPWGNAYVYRSLPKDKYELLSRGADGVPGGEGDAADITAASKEGSP